MEVKEHNNKRTIVIAFFCVGVLLLTAAWYGIGRLSSSRGRRDYTVRMEQYVSEYSEEYEYDAVITVEYPCLEGLASEVQKQLNGQLYDVAMDRVNYWHFDPDEKVQTFQKEYFSIFCSDVRCRVAFHSQFLLSVDLYEIYSTYNPLWEVKCTKRALNANLITGDVYQLEDVFIIDQAFAELWYRALCEQTETDFSEEDEEIFLSWFLREDAQLESDYVICPWFCVEENGEFTIGISVDPKASAGVSGNVTPQDCYVFARIAKEDLESCRREDSPFWKLYEKSQSAGEVTECADRREHIWFGENGSVWGYWESN